MKITIFGLLLLAPLLAFSQACPRLPNAVRISATGDILIHQALYRNVIGPQSFKVLWADLIPVLRDSDLTIGNLEGPTAPGFAVGGRPAADPGFVYDGIVYSGTKMIFNYHPQLISDLKASGFGLVTTANNHALDRGGVGIDRTIENLEQRGLPFVGTRPRGSTEDFEKTIRVGSLRIGVVACTEMTNGWNDSSRQLLRCGSREVVDSILRLRQQADGVFVFPHWGVEYQSQPNGTQRSWARQWVAAGATAVIGNHPHVVQTTEWLSGPGRRALVVYSLGNFVAAQGALEKRTSAVVHLDLVAGSSGVEIAQFSYTPFLRPSGSFALSRIRSGGEFFSAATHVTRQLGPSICR